MAEGTIEERVIALQQEKKELIDQVLSRQAENTLTGLSEE